MNYGSVDTGTTKFFTPQNEPFYSANQYKRLNSDNKEFRVLQVLPGTQDSLIQCKLVEPPQSTDLSYECISYRAGDPEDVHQIKVNGNLFNVFATLGAALHKLRLPDRSRVLWADQICINQSDVTERGSQVQQMRGIYENADRVHAWLGHLDNSDLAMQEVLHLESEFNNACGVYSKTIGSERSLMPVERRSIMEQIAHSLKTRYEDEENEAVMAQCSAFGQMFQSEFWERLWIMQEVIVAKAVSLTWDSCSIDFARFSVYANIMASLLDILDRERLPVPRNNNPILKRLAGGSRLYYIKLAKLTSLQNIWKQRGNIDFKNILQFSMGKKCSDPRDRIFALCGMISNHYNIVPDYTHSIQSVYLSSVLSMITAERSLDVLAYCHHPHPHGLTNKLPSWCPDWSLPTNLRNRRQALLWDDAGFSLCRFQASKTASAQCHWEISMAENDTFAYVSLYVEGIALGTVQVIGEVPRSGTERSEESFEQLVKCWSELVTQQRCLTHCALQESEKTATVDDRGYPDVTIPRNAIDTSNYERLKLDAVEGNRRFIITDSGYMGMAPPHVKEGDSVCVLLGARVPFLLRQESKFYTLVGELYLSDGLMTGKAIDMMEAGELHKTMFEIR